MRKFYIKDNSNRYDKGYFACHYEGKREIVHTELGRFKWASAAAGAGMGLQAVYDTEVKKKNDEARAELAELENSLRSAEKNGEERQ